MSKYEQEILHEVALRGRIEVNELASFLGVTNQTIRRVVQPMVDRGDVEKVHGAILSKRPMADPPFMIRMEQHRREKLEIANEVAALIRDGDKLAIDTGSTSGFIAMALRQRKRLTVVTNSAFVASTLSMVPDNKVFMAGTQLRSHDGAAFDRAAFGVIETLEADYAILSASSVHPRRGFLVQEQCEADISRAMMEIAGRRIMAVDHSKFGDSHASLALPALSQGDIVVIDRQPEPEFSDLLSGLTLRVTGR